MEIKALKDKSRSVIAAIIAVLTGLVTMSGAVVDGQQIQQLGELLNEFVGIIITLFGIIMYIFRAITSSPLVGYMTKGAKKNDL